MSEQTKSIIVTVSDDALNSIHQLANQLAINGMKVDQVMPITGVISGSCDATKVPALEKIDGIISIEEESTISLPPSNSTVQ